MTTPNESRRLFSRALVRISPQDEIENAAAFLQGLVTNDVTAALPCYGALLTPQGKVQFDFLIWRDGQDLLLDCEVDASADLIKRLSLYRLRRKIAIARDDALAVHWCAPGSAADAPADAQADPRLAALGLRWIAPPSSSDSGADQAWLAHRLAQGVCEGRAELGDLLWLECNAAELNGVSFTKGCYVGQENTARMNWRQKVNRRLVIVPLDQSDPARRRAVWPELGLALDHRRVEDIPRTALPAWLSDALDTDVGKTGGD
jgi:folate-binding protein YgfZ